MKKEEIEMFNIKNEILDTNNPLSVGNGDLAVTVDILGTQTFYEAYNTIPLTSISATCFVTNPKEPKILPKRYQAHSHEVGYFTDNKNQEESFEQLRTYPYKFHFFLFELWNNQKKIRMEDVSFSLQELDLYEGIIHSEFQIQEKLIQTNCMVDEVNEIFRFEIKGAKGLQIKIVFPKSSYTAKASCYPLLDSFEFLNNVITRYTEHESFEAYLYSNMNAYHDGKALLLSILDDASYFEIAIHKQLRYQAHKSFFDSIDARLLTPQQDLLTKEQCNELNRRMILSMYVLKVNSCGKYPPSETGVTMNSWNSKFHLEMHPWHSLWLAKYGLTKRLERQLYYYKTILKSSKNRAKAQGYLGARFPKMTSYLGEDSPSSIGPLLLWQQPHLLLMLEACYNATKNLSLIEEFEEVLDELILFLESFIYKGDDYVYHLDYPLIPAQECYDPAFTKDPIFEVEYVRYAFQKMIQFKSILKHSIKPIWYDYIAYLIPPAQKDGCYLATQDNQGKQTYHDFAYDHPLVLMAYSLIQSDRLENQVLKNTLKKVLKSYNLEELWGWDFPMMALTAIHLEMKKEAVELLLLDTPKNQYLKNGHNRQGSRTDLPLYLPGNGAFLLALKELLN